MARVALVDGGDYCHSTSSVSTIHLCVNITRVHMSKWISTRELVYSCCFCSPFFFFYSYYFFFSSFIIARADARGGCCGIEIKQPVCKTYGFIQSNSSRESCKLIRANILAYNTLKRHFIFRPYLAVLFFDYFFFIPPEL